MDVHKEGRSHMDRGREPKPDFLVDVIIIDDPTGVQIVAALFRNFKQQRIRLGGSVAHSTVNPPHLKGAMKSIFTLK